MIGRIDERRELEASLAADDAQLIAVCGRRRVGKTYLVRESFRGDFFFEHTGILRVHKLSLQACNIPLAKEKKPIAELQP